MADCKMIRPVAGFLLTSAPRRHYYSSMCGRYTLFQKTNEISGRFNVAVEPSTMPANYNVAPGQMMPVVIEEDGTRKLELMKWGLVPVWAKDPKIGYKLINARDDTIFDKPMWRSVILRKRALIPANGFYEWKRPVDPKGRKIPFYIHPRDQELFAFAGVWEVWRDHEGAEWRTYSIITTDPNREMSSVHNRMPVILHPSDEAAWLDESLHSREQIEPYLHPYEDGGLDMFEVSSDVNVVKNNDQRLIYPINSK
jgi:putative SOS response-associated peptidase YedK